MMMRFTALRRWAKYTYACAAPIPIDEINALVEGILADGIITDDERNMPLGIPFQFCRYLVHEQSFR